MPACDLLLSNLIGEKSKYTDTIIEPMVPMISNAVEPLKSRATATRSDPSTSPSALLSCWSFQMTIRILKATARPIIAYNMTTPSEVADDPETRK